MTATESTAPTPAPEGLSRTRVIAARALVVLGVVLLVISLLANFVKREALDEPTFRETSRELIANEAIRDQIAVTMVDALYANVDVSGRLQARLPEDLQPLAAPLAGLAREGLDRAARELLERPRVQTLFVGAASLAQEQVARVLEGESARLETVDGSVVLDLRPLVVTLGDRFGFLGDLDETLAPDAAQVTILQSDELEAAQDATQLLKIVADWIWIFALAAWALALWLVPGRRRRELRAIGIGLVVAGVAVLVIRAVAGSYLVENLAESETVQPAVSAFWEILSSGIAADAWVVMVIGVIAALGAWLTGGGRRARGARRTVGPWLERGGLAWGIFAGVLLLVVWALPLHRFLTAVILVVLSAIGFELIRRQVVQEIAEEEPRPAATGWRPSPPWHRDAAAPSRVEELERLGRLRSDGLLTEEEYASAKARSLERVGD